MDGSLLTPELILDAYRQGAFPMADESGDVEWYRSNARAVFDLQDFRPSRSLAKVMRQGRFRVTFDAAFREVMRGCLRPEGNWISEDFIRVYGEIHDLGWGHSCEVWLGDALVGGLYGIRVGRCFCAESMFHRETNASKVALASMIFACRDAGFTLFDAQVMNAHLESMGAIEMTDGDYQIALSKALSQDLGSKLDLNLRKS